MTLVHRSVMMALPVMAAPPANVVHVAPGVTSSFINGLPQDTIVQFANCTYSGLALLPKAGQVFRRTSSLSALVTFRCCALGVQNSKRCRIEHNLCVINRANSVALNQHNRATGAVDTPKGGVYIGWFTGPENEWSGNVYLLLANGPFVEQFASHSCSNPNVACTGVSCSFMCGTSQTGCNITSTPTGPTLGGNFMCFIPQAGDDHHNVSTNNTYRIVSGTAAKWPFDTRATTLGNPAAFVPDWQQIPSWTTPPGKT